MAQPSTLLFQPDDTPDLYVDTVRISTGPYDLVMEIGLTGVPNAPGSEPPPTRTLARLRMSPQHALIFNKLLKKNLDAYQSQIGKINLPKQMFDDLDVSPED